VPAFLCQKTYQVTLCSQFEALGEFAMAEQIRQILVDEQDHQIDLATALGVEVPNVSNPTK
jgi:bacterioferritin